jgi:hypothetical protein
VRVRITAQSTLRFPCQRPFPDCSRFRVIRIRTRRGMVESEGIQCRCQAPPGATSRLTSFLQDSQLLSPPALSASDNPEDRAAADYFGWSTPLTLSITSSTSSWTLPTFSLASPA